MLKDFAKTSPVTFFALPLLIIGLLVLSYFFYSTLLTNQIEARSTYLKGQLQVTIDGAHRQVDEFRSEIPFLSELDDFGVVFTGEDEASSKLRFRLKRLVNRYNDFIDTLYIYNDSSYYYLGIDSKGTVAEGFGNLIDNQFPLQFTHKTKVIHLEGNRSLAMIPVYKEDAKDRIYLAVVIDVFNLIKLQSDNQYIGDHGFKIIFSENMGFREASRGEKELGEFILQRNQQTKIVNSLLEHKGGSLLHSSLKQPDVMLTVYEPIKLFSDRYGLIFSVSDQDFLKPVKAKLQVIFISFFAIIVTVIVVFIINLRDVSRNASESN
ncbi:hypothetical protein KFE98_09070 [bacterium SCSIO 12741]|nr:hypothetical protein KFE98_09070 [bacterium SCSIO 12741]